MNVVELNNLISKLYSISLYLYLDKFTREKKQKVSGEQNSSFGASRVSFPFLHPTKRTSQDINQKVHVIFKQRGFLVAVVLLGGRVVVGSNPYADAHTWRGLP